MDIAAFKKSWSVLLMTLPVIDPTTGLQKINPVDLTPMFTKAFPQAPFSLAEQDLPLWVLFTGPATYPVPPDQSQGRLAIETRDFTAVLYVAISQSGVDGEAERLVQPYVDNARDIIQSHIQLWDGVTADRVPGIQRAFLIRDSGINGNLIYGQPNPKYVGISYTVRVENKNQVNYDPRQ